MSAKTYAVAPWAVVVFETEVHDLAFEPDEYGLDTNEALAYRILDLHYDHTNCRFTVPADPAQATIAADKLHSIANGYSDQADGTERQRLESAYERRVARHTANGLTTLALRISRSLR